MKEIKQAYQEKAAAQLRQWQGWIESYKSSPRLAMPKRVGDPQQWTERLEDCHRIASVRLAELGSSQEERWELSKQAVERAMIELKKALDESGAGNSATILQIQSSRSHAYEPFQRKG